MRESVFIFEDDDEVSREGKGGVLGMGWEGILCK